MNAGPAPRVLHEDEQWYEFLGEHCQDLLCEHDLDGRLLSVNPASARLLGYSVEEILKISMRDLVAPEFRPHFDEYLHRVETRGEAEGFLSVVTRYGDRRIWKYHNTLHGRENGKPIVRGIAHDITEQKQVERLLREAGEDLLRKVREHERTIGELKLFRTLVDKSRDAIEVIDPVTLRFLDVNEKACSDLGYTREELLKMNVFDINPAIENTAKNLREHLRQTGSLMIEAEHRRKDGTTFPVEVNITQVQLEKEYIVAIARDITGRKQSEERLQASESRYRALHERAAVGISAIDTKTGRFLSVNPKYCEITGRTEEDLLGRDFQSITHPDDLAENVASMQQLTNGDLRHYEMEKRYIRPNGEIRWTEVRIVALGPEGEAPACHAAIVQDITERKQAQERLREYERVVEETDEMIVVLDRDRRFVIANQAYLNLRGTTREGVIGKTVEEVLGDSAYKEVVKAKLDECYQGKVARFEMKYEYPKVGERDLSLSYFPIEGPSGVERVLAIFRDVTEHKLREGALRRSEEQYRLFVSQSSVGIFREEMEEPIPADAGEEGLVQSILHQSYVAECNDALAAMYGLGSGAEVTGRKWIIPPDDPENIALTRAYVRSGFRLFEYQSKEKDIYGNAKVFVNSLIGTVENGRLVRTWGIQRDITERVRLEEAQRKAEANLLETVSRLSDVTEELRQAKEKLAEKKEYLEESIDTELGFGEIIGRSDPLKEVMQKIARVAPSDATVLLLGETGTGKELAARRLHHMSGRQKGSFIKMNCAAIPSGLLESELFGHEKGAFTGALQRKLGRLELADGGTLFLDEIGEIPLSLQPKLLRALQDMEFERLGSTQTLKVNFRLLAATNRDLAQSVKKGEFRSDLYYRLNVFPVVMPALRERRQDIPLLVQHFVKKFAQHMKKSISSVPAGTMETMVRWDWPGNVRELENFVERSVILTSGPVLQAPLAELESEKARRSESDDLKSRERNEIVSALRQCHGRVGGADGAAARLGLKRTTLQSKMDHMGIKPGEFRG